MDIAEKVVKTSHVVEKAKDEIEAIIHTEKTDTTETQGRNKEIDKDTPINEVKAPNLLERAKEEVEAVAEVIQTQKNVVGHHCEQPKNDGGFWSFIGKLFERFCSPNSKRD